MNEALIAEIEAYLKDWEQFRGVLISKGMNSPIDLRSVDIMRNALAALKAQPTVSENNVLEEIIVLLNQYPRATALAILAEIDSIIKERGL